MPRLSVLLPVKNGAAHLPAALASTVAALPADAELVVVDDASDDATPAILARAAEGDRRVRVMRREASSGVAAALNHGLRHSDSELVGRMDADDVCARGRFRSQTALLDRADFVFGSMLLTDPAGRLRGAASPLPITPAAARYHLLVGNFLSHPTMSCRRSAMESLGGYADIVVEDYELWLRAAAAGLRLRKTVRPVLRYRVHPAQITRTWAPAATDALLDERYSRLLPEHLRELTPVLRHSAVTRRRDDEQSAAAWRRLRDWIRREARGLRPFDRLVLAERLRSI
ncbi:glycosyltransferase [Amnibacterium sp.]|uniref:glycosyltransferase family 2 protein n=1 Tax=Amnibacterium sp. TaxID=1872496 RepID=UPI002620019D|nr:glycosyltransferase [Amnibacterium sp.]MCU1473945.1 polypeptide N-acetylgalactosaminyltransferase [Amnibacterium sp.]